MSSDDLDITPEQRKLEEQLRELPVSEPNPDFFARLRDEFAHGKISKPLDEPTLHAVDGTRDDSGATGAAAPGSTPGAFESPLHESSGAFGSDSSRRREPSSRGRNLRLFLFPAMAAAAALFLFLFRPPTSEFQVRGEGGGTVAIGGLTFPVTDTDAYRDLLVPGAMFHVEGDMATVLEFEVGDRYKLVATPGVEMTVPATIGKSGSDLEITNGEIRVTSMEGLAQAPLSIDAPGSRIDVMGTTLAVICSPDSVCVCLLDGNAMMTDRDGSPMQLEPGMRRIRFNDNDDPDMIEPIRGDERMKLEALRSRVAP